MPLAYGYWQSYLTTNNAMSVKLIAKSKSKK